jgi:hypothetical protein
MLEAFSDGFGGWRVIDVLGSPIVELPDWLVQDLLTLKWLAGILRGKKRDSDDKD